MANIITKIFGTKHDRDIKKIRPLVEEINEFYQQYQSLTEEQLTAKTDEFKKRLEEGETLEDILPEAFAVVKDACRRLCGTKWDVAGMEMEWNMVPYDVQLIGGAVLHQGKIAEMATGEGKTLVATLPIYLNALSGKGVHLVTVNDYLAKRDSQWMGRIYEFLGLTVGCIQNDMTNAERRIEYNKDITYGTNNEFGFDYLRDNMAQTVEDRVQRGYNYAIVDEVDSVLIDEARTPLIISGQVESLIHKRYSEMNPIVETLVRKQTNLVNEKISKAERLLQAENSDGQFEAGQLLLAARKGAPKNKKYLKLVQEPGILNIINQVESTYMRDKKLHEMDETLYYVIDEKENSINLTDNGRSQFSREEQELFTIPDITEALSQLEGDDSMTPEEKTAKIDELYRLHSERSEKVHTIGQLLKAYSLFEKDVEYVVQDDRVMIVDEFTGRILPGRRYSDGLHQAIEAKEKVRIESESQTLATITLQNYFRMYDKLAGMTGTAETEAQELFDIYKLDVVCIPTNEPVRRIDSNDVIYRTRREKYNAIVNEIIDCFNAGRPVLVGTVSVEVSETLSRMLKRTKIPHNVLNAKFHQMEAEIVSKAGHKGSVTIATNMAGRGTDIKLGPGVVKHENCALKDPRTDEEICPFIDELKCRENVPCGLHIIGTERHESRRIDRQLRGRSGRQGDPGSSSFFLSLEDDLMRLFGSDRLGRIMDRLGVQEGEVIAHPMVNKAIERAQKRVEMQNFAIRKHTLEYDDVMNSQREVIYDRRLAALERESIKEEIMELIESVLQTIIDNYCPPKEYPENWNLIEFKAELLRVYLLNLEFRQEDIPNLTREKLFDQVHKAVLTFYEQKERLYGEDIMRRLERYAVLTTIDRHWRDNMYEMDQLKTGIGLRAYGQRDPLVEYKREAYRIFAEMIQTVDKDIVGMVFKLQVRMPEKSREERRREAQKEVTAIHQETVGMGFGSATQAEEANPMADASKRGKAKPIRREVEKVGPNDPCPCGSGKKYKKCHGRME
ncbi:MAG: preprotein translocase subunit SecA [candidate division Zixibacteria bacterium HGW-Zixibacteria-1]|nr:MAG: preprotein translocase subunit SecA [candidate division Zixibacteria bacterium HGW-Zixibacteria-1]